MMQIMFAVGTMDKEEKYSKKPQRLPRLASNCLWCVSSTTLQNSL
jgi:hypothetical protein